MLIPVMYKNGHHDQVKDFVLPKLITNHEISKFKRSSGWVTIGIDRIRDMHRAVPYPGEERRQAEMESEELINIF